MKTQELTLQVKYNGQQVGRLAMGADNLCRFEYSLDYKDLAQITNTLTHSVVDAEQLLRQMVFNVLIENMDDHAKNFSFLYKHNKWELSPAYDILRSAGFNGEHATAVAGAGKPTRKDMQAVAAHIGFPTKK